MPATIASVAPQVTVTIVSGSIGDQPGKCSTVEVAIASRSGFAPQVVAYWLMSSWSARAAASFSSGGQAKSGKPWARLTAPSITASRFISRMTDSVKLAALAEMRAVAHAAKSTAWPRPSPRPRRAWCCRS